MEKKQVPLVHNYFFREKELAVRAGIPVQFIFLVNYHQQSGNAFKYFRFV